MGLTSHAFCVEKPQTEQDSCVTQECHGEHASKKTIHDPINEDSCEACHEVDDVKEHTYIIAYEGSELCIQCHDELSKKYVHGAMDDGDCLQCHEQHASDSESLLRAKTVAEMCQTCHEVAENATYIHGPTSVGECSLCHEAHESDHKNRLTMGLDELCVFCHVATREDLEGIEFVHEPVRDSCVGCHDPHGANNRKMLKVESPDMCFSCHEEIQTKAQASKHQHKAILEQDGCLKCHTPHGSSVRPLLASAPPTLCLTCHAKPMTVTVNEVLPAFIDQIKDKTYLHGPIKENDCGGCHMTHGSDHFRILAGAYPAGFYTSFDETKYELCFGCHEKTLVQMSTTDDLTDFRNGNQNLHFLHVNKESRGRTCRACHQAHASNQPKHIRKSVLYGEWNLPIEFSKTDTGGLCDPGCHSTVGYDRQTAVDYTTSGRTTCPTADVSGDCYVGLADLAIMASQWMTEGIPEPKGMVWVSIDDSGAGMKDWDGNPVSHGGFTGEMSKYETTNAQYCQFLNAALASGDVVVDGSYVNGSDGSNSGADFFDQTYYFLAGPGAASNGAANGEGARINYSGGVFTVDPGFDKHPVTYMSWYGSTAFCNYYGYRLPTEWEWQAVADFDGSYTYGCGTSINNSIANYYDSTYPDGTTTVVGSFGSYGYGLSDMTGNVWEWTSTVNGSDRVIRGGGWPDDDSILPVSFWSSLHPTNISSHSGFRVCR